MTIKPYKGTLNDEYTERTTKHLREARDKAIKDYIASRDPIGQDYLKEVWGIDMSVDQYNALMKDPK